jgi:hypothetical protein
MYTTTVAFRGSIESELGRQALCGKEGDGCGASQRMRGVAKLREAVARQVKSRGVSVTQLGSEVLFELSGERPAPQPRVWFREALPPL